MAVGASSLVSSMFSGFAVGVSLSRSVVQKSTGGKSQVSVTEADVKVSKKAEDVSSFIVLFFDLVPLLRKYAFLF